MTKNEIYSTYRVQALHKFYMHTLYTDGSHASEINIGAIGGYLLNSKNKEVWNFSQSIYQDLQHHELKSIEYALDKCLQSNVKNVICYTDSLSCVKDLNKRQKRDKTDSYSLLLNKVIDTLHEFQHIIFHHIPREQNKKANFYARQILTKITKNQSRVQIYQNLYPSSNYVKSDKIFCIEQFTDKTVFNSVKNNTLQYYVFDLYREQCDNTLDIYSVDLQEDNTLVQKIQSYSIYDTWGQYLNAITQTLKQCAENRVGLILCPANNEIDLILRGMKIPNSKYSVELERLLHEIKGFKSILIDSDSQIYQAVFIDQKHKYYSSHANN